MTDIYIVSGFLGAGKTTLIRKLLKEEAFHKAKTVLIENDFGEISIDAALLKSGGIEVKEINSGCICCSLSGDFVKALSEVIRTYHPDQIIIEPSGVGKLSDIVRACGDAAITPAAAVKTKITVADVKHFMSYLENFGEFFEDQIKYADLIVLSRSEYYPDKRDAAIRQINELNPHSVILSGNWDRIRASEIIHQDGCDFANCLDHGHHHQHCCHEHQDNDHGHDCNADHEHQHCGHDHDHSAEEIFDTVTIHTNRRFSNEELKACIDKLHHLPGTVLRAKGILRGHTGFIDLQYIPGELKLADCSAAGGMLCIIGRDLNRQELVRLFEGV